MAKQIALVISIMPRTVVAANTAKNKTNVLILPMMVRKMALINKPEYVPYGDTQVPMDYYECGPGGTMAVKIPVDVPSNVQSAANYIVIRRSVVMSQNRCLYCGKDISDLGRHVCPACEKDKTSVHKFLKRKRGKRK